MNNGKEFEQDIKLSLEKMPYLWIYRPSDFGGGQAQRFTNYSLCDYIVFNTKERELYLLELKSIQGKSISCPSVSLINQIQNLKSDLDNEEDNEIRKKIKEQLKILLKKANGYKIKYHQLKGLTDIDVDDNFNNIYPYFLINFRDINKTYIFNATDLMLLLKEIKKSSINLDDIEKSYGLLVPSTQVRNTKHYIYDLEKVLWQ